MLRIDKRQELQGITVFGDDRQINKFYLLPPSTPRFRINPETRQPVFKLVQYRHPIERAEGKVGGGFLFFDVDFAIPEATKQAVREVLQEGLNRQASDSGEPVSEVELASITFTKGTTSLSLEEMGSAFFEKVWNPGKPSLFGDLVSSYAVELSPAGTELMKALMQGQGAGGTAVSYDLLGWAKLPPMVVTASFHAEKFYSFHQEIDIDWNLWGEDSYRETLRETFSDSESMEVHVDPGGITDQALVQQISDWARRNLESAVERKMIEAIAPVPEDDRKRPDSIEKVTRDISVEKIASFTLKDVENKLVEWPFPLSGNLPALMSTTDGDGNALRWEDFYMEVDLESEFFQQINVAIQVNADFERLPLHSVEVHLEYQEGDAHQIWEEPFTNADEVKKFASFIENDNRNYKYWYEVNYTGESQTYKSEEIETNESSLVVGVDDVGILSIDVLPGDLNFEQVAQAQVTIQYQDQAHGIDVIERQFILDKDHQEHQFLEVIFQPRSNPYFYQVKYFMADGKEFEVDWAEGRSPQLAINDPFSAMKTVTLIAAGDLETKISSIFLDLKFMDKTNGYLQSTTVALNRGNPFFSWEFPVIDELSGQVSYSGSIQYIDGTVKPITVTETTESQILVGDVPRGFLEVLVIPDLIDFSQVKLARLSLLYEDAANSIKETDDLIIRSEGKELSWKVELTDPTKIDYQWKATFFMADGSRRETDLTTTTDETVLLEIPAA